MKMSILKMNLQSRKTKRLIKFYVRLVLHNYTLFLFHRKKRQEVFWRKLLGSLMGCKSYDCIFNEEGNCINPIEYNFSVEKKTGKLRNKQICSCSNGIWRNGNDWTEQQTF